MREWAVIHARRRLSRRAAWFVSLALLGSAFVAVGAAPRTESEVRALYLLKFLKFVEWPAEEKPGPLRIGVVGDSEVWTALKRLAEGKVLEGRVVRIRAANVSRDFADCDILFISAEAHRQTSRVLAALRGKPVLTVGEREGFLDEGGMIELARRENQIRCRLNLLAAGRAGLKVKAKLIEVADVNKGGPDA